LRNVKNLSVLIEYKATGHKTLGWMEFLNQATMFLVKEVIQMKTKIDLSPETIEHLFFKNVLEFTKRCVAGGCQ